jgi:hypothetical protein
MKYVIIKRWIVEAANETEANQVVERDRLSPVSHQTFPAGDQQYKQSLGFRDQMHVLFFGKSKK